MPVSDPHSRVEAQESWFKVLGSGRGGYRIFQGGGGGLSLRTYIYCYRYFGYDEIHIVFLVIMM